MTKRLLIGLFFALWFPLTAAAATYQALPNVAVGIPDLPASWQMTTEPIDLMVEHIAEHVKEAAASAGQYISDRQALKAARERLKREELIFYNEISKAYILVSFEARGDDESVPTKEDLKLSAKYAASGVEDEGWEDTKLRFMDATTKGAQLVQRFSIEYTYKGDRGLFSALVGYAEPFWFWVYAKDHGQDSADEAVIEGIISNFEVRIK